MCLLTYWTTDGARSYFWVDGNLSYVHFHYDTSRAGQVSRDILRDDFTGTLVTDCYFGDFASVVGAKQTCLAHLARRANDWQRLTDADSEDYQFLKTLKSLSNVDVRCTDSGPKAILLRGSSQRKRHGCVKNKRVLKLVW